MQLSKGQCDTIAHAIIGDVRQYVLDNQERYTLFLEEKYGKDSEITKRELKLLKERNKQLQKNP